MDAEEESAKKKISVVVGEITALEGRFGDLVPKFESKIDQIESAAGKAAKYDQRYWELSAFRSAIVKLRKLIRQNFNYIETLAMLAVTRYAFELAVWLKTIDRDQRYALVFCSSVLANQKKHLEQHMAKTKQEIAVFKRLEEKEHQLVESFAKESVTASDKKELSSKLKAIEDEVDQEARRTFSLYADSAKTNGYGYQVHLLETQGIKQIQDRLTIVEEEREAFLKSCSPDIRKLLQQRWKWNERAEAVGMLNQYQFLYAYTSRLLHATPVSFFTNQQNLEYSEVAIFLDYVYVTMLDILDLAEQKLR